MTTPSLRVSQCNKAQRPPEQISMPIASPPSALLAPIENNELATLSSAIEISGSPSLPILNELLAHAIRHNATETIPHLVSLGASPLSHPSFDLLYTSTAFPSFQCLVETGKLDINIDLEAIGTYLILAVKRNNKSHVEFCLKHGADANQGTYAFRWSALATAAEYDADLDIVDLLIAGGADLNSSDALHTAAEKGRYEMVKFLIGKGANVNEVGFEYCLSDSKYDEAGTALHFAVDANNTEVAKLLLENGADVAIRDAKGRTAMERATEKGMDDIRLYLDKASRHG